MRKLFVSLVLSLSVLNSASAEELKANPDPNIAGDDVVICVATNVYLIHPQLSLVTQTVDAPIKDLCKAFVSHKSIEEVHILTGGDANADNLRTLLQMLAKRGTYGQVTFAYRGLGYGADQDDTPRLMLADWNAADPLSGLDIETLDALLSAVASRNVVILDAVIPAEDEILGGLATMGPSAPDWPSSTSFVISPTGPHAQSMCGDQMLRGIAAQVRSVAPDKELTLADMREAVLDGAQSIRSHNCSSYAPTIYGGGNWAKNALLLTEVIAGPETTSVSNVITVPTTVIGPENTAVTLPVEPLKKPARTRMGVDTVVLGSVAAALGGASVVSGLLLNDTMASMQTPDAIAANYGTDQAALDQAAALRPIYGWTMLGTGAGALGALAGATVTVVFK